MQIFSVVSKRLLGVFLILLLCPAAISAREIPCEWSKVEKIVAIGDIHGDYENFLSILEKVGIVNDNLHWTGGKTHLVQIGDILDRGPGAKDAFDLLMRLEKESEAAGGMVHVLLGNHEELNITGRSLDYPSYVTVEQFISFIPEDFFKKKTKDYIKRLPDKDKALAESQGLNLSSDGNFRLFWEKLIRGDKEARSVYVRNFDNTYGKWLLQKNAVIKINDIIFSHAGISEKYSKWKLRDINDQLRSELRHFIQSSNNPIYSDAPFSPKIVYDSLSPLWYRGLATSDERSAQKKVFQTLNRLKARYMVTGHNFFQYGKRSPFLDIDGVRHFGGRVYNIDTGINRIYGGLVAALVIDNGTFALRSVGIEQLISVSLPQQDKEAEASRRRLELFLKSATIENINDLQTLGRTAPWIINLKDASFSRRAIFKYINHPRPDILLDSYKYELAAYELSKYLSLELVPPMVEREIKGLTGSLQIMVKNTISEWERREQNLQPKDVKTLEQAMADLRVFENLVYESCENLQDTLFDQTTSKIYRIDFSQSFAPENTTLQECQISRCSKSLYQRLLSWDKEKVGALMVPYLNEEEIRALNTRRDLIVSMIGKLVESNGEESVLLRK
jgi:hypothetical protein